MNSFLDRLRRKRLINYIYTLGTGVFSLFSVVIILSCPFLTGQMAAGAIPHVSGNILHNTSSSQQETLPLEMARPVEREMPSGGRHVYQIELSQGQYLRLTVEQKNIDVAIQVSGPNGSLRAKMDSP